VQIQEGEGYAQFRMNFGYQKLCTSYYTVKKRTITLDITYLSSRTNPAGDTMRRSRNMQLTTRGRDKGVACEITRTVHSLALNFSVRAIYICPNIFLDLQINRASSTFPVKVESRARSRRRPKSWDTIPGSLSTGRAILSRMACKRRDRLVYIVDSMCIKIKNKKMSSCGDLRDHPLIETPTCQVRISRTAHETPCGFCAAR